MMIFKERVRRVTGVLWRTLGAAPDVVKWFDKLFPSIFSWRRLESVVKSGTRLGKLAILPRYFLRYGYSSSSKNPLETSSPGAGMNPSLSAKISH